MIWPGRHQIGMVAAMRLEWVAAFVGIRRLPARSVVRGSRWGNPFTVEEHGQAEAIALFRRLVAVAAPGDGMHPETIRHHLRGFNLACYCELADACHADVLLAIANDAP